MSRYAVRIDSFAAVDLKPGDDRDYAKFRDKALEAGRFSVFEATENERLANLYTRLCHDPQVYTDHSCGFPWTTVRWRKNPNQEDDRA